MKDYKRIPFPHLFNCRDLGGYACTDGKFFAYHKIYRSDVPAALGEEEWHYLKEEMGVRTMIDLRSTGEQKMTPYKAPEGIVRFSCPMMAEGGEADENGLNSLGELSELSNGKREGKAGVDVELVTLEDMAKIKEMLKKKMASAPDNGFTKSLEQQYDEMLEEAPERAATVLNLIGEHILEGAVLYHCSVGKDRTGVTSALIYLLCGVAEADILADYQVSGDYLRQNKMMFASLPEEMHCMMESRAETMRHFLQSAREKDYIGVLYANGLKESAVEAIRKAVMEG